MSSDPNFRSILMHGASRYGLSLDDSMLRGFERYTALLVDWNTRMNLVSARDMDRFIEYHLLDSLKAASVFDFFPVRSLLDFGSGAGLPGVPLAISFPNMQTMLLDSREKRWKFLDESVRYIPLPHATAVRSRIEELPASFNTRFDCVISRATVSLSDFFRLAVRFVAPGGSLVAIKGDFIENEFDDLVSLVDRKVFHIRKEAPTEVSGVRTGHVVIVSKT